MCRYVLHPGQTAPRSVLNRFMFRQIIHRYFGCISSVQFQLLLLFLVMLILKVERFNILQKVILLNFFTVYL